jgi:hypothetical protein
MPGLEHKARAASDLFFCALALLSAAAIALPVKWAQIVAALALAVLISGAIVLGMGGCIAYAGGKVRHREFRNGPAPPKTSQDAHFRARVSNGRFSRISGWSELPCLSPLK